MSQSDPVVPAWIAIDWGTSNVRAWAMDGSDAVLAQKDANRGMLTLKPDEFEATLLTLVANWLVDGRATPVIACGMVGARQGWIEAPYRRVPSAPLAVDQAMHVPTTDKRLNMWILPGMCQHEPADVMRGEETQLAGLLATQPDFEGTVCMPGTHTKWTHIENGQVNWFKSCMTGELFALLQTQSVLKHSLAGAEFDAGAYETAIATCVHDQHCAVLDLFSIRAQDLLFGVSPAVARAQLSATLIGAEINATRAVWQGSPVVLVGDPALTKLYESAFKATGVQTQSAAGNELTLNGLRAAHTGLSKALKKD